MSEEEDKSVEVEESTEESLPEQAPEQPEASQEEDTSPEEAENTAEEDSEPREEPPKESRASQRIRELVAQKKVLESRLQAKAEDTPLEGVDETGIDPNKFAAGLERKILARTQGEVERRMSIQDATRKYPEAETNPLIGTRATALIYEGYTPLQAAEMATLEYQDQVEAAQKKSATRASASQKTRQGTEISPAGRTRTSDDEFTEEEIDSMSVDEYATNQDKILRQYGLKK